MYMDKMLEFSDSQAFAAISVDQETVSTDICDLGVLETDAFGTTITPDIGNAGELIWHVMVDATFTGGGGATLKCDLITKSSPSSMSSGSTIVDTVTIPNLAAAGTHYQRPVPMGTAFAQYVAVLYTGLVDITDTGTVSSWIDMSRNLTDSSGGAIQT